MDTSGTNRHGVDIVIQHESLSVDPQLCRRTLHLVFSGEGADVQQITLIQSDHATVSQLNRSYLGHDYDTDVLAFLYSDPNGPLDGEIYVDLDTADERHAEFGTTFEQEVLRYSIHGALHLIGYRDHEPDGRAQMQEIEDRYLRNAGML